LEEYDDGWAMGYNITTGKQGVFPVECINGADGADYVSEYDRTSYAPSAKRVSSMYAATDIDRFSKYTDYRY
jgi:hypothetical protein